MIVALVSYADTVTDANPFGDVFRKVLGSPGETQDDILNLMCRADGCGVLEWKAHTDPTRTPVIFFVDADSAEAQVEFTGTP